MPKAILQIDQLSNVRGSKILDDYGGGLNDTTSNEKLDDNEAIIRKNWHNESIGAIEKVNGFTKQNSTALASKPITGLFRVYQSDGTTKLLAICNGVLSYSDDDGAAFTGATSGTGLSTTAFNSGVNYNDLFFFSNTTDNLKHYTPGTDTMAAATNKPTNPCRIILKRADRRMLALVNTTAGSALYYSKVDPTGAAADDWSAANDAGSISIDGAKSEPLSGGMTFGATDIIFKDYAAFKVWGYPTPQAIRMPGSPGCAAPQSVSQGEGIGFHLSHDAIWLWDGNRFINISKGHIDTIIKSIASSYITQAFGIYRDGLFWFFYTPSGQTTNQKCVIYDIFNSNPYENRNIWYERDDLAMNCPVVFNGVGDANELLAGTSASTGFVYRLDYSATGADDTSSIEAIYQTKYFTLDTPHIVKRFAKIHLRYYSAKGTIIVTWYTNRGTTSGSFNITVSQTGVALGSFTLGTDILASDVEATHTEPLPDTAVGKDISLKFYHKDTGVAPIIRDCELEYEYLYRE